MIALLLASLLGAESLPACSLDSLALSLDSVGVAECVIDGTSDTLAVWPDEERIEWAYSVTGPVWVAEGRVVWGIHRDARLYPSRQMLRDDLYIEDMD